MITSPRTIAKIQEGMRLLRPFKVGNISGQLVEPGEQSLLPVTPNNRGSFVVDLAINGWVYVVYSYRIPIAWSVIDRVWRIPDSAYPHPTNGHLRVVKMIAARLMEAKSSVQKDRSTP